MKLQIFCSLALMCASLGCQAQVKSAGIDLASNYPFLIITDDGSKEPLISDSLFNSRSRGIRFRVNKTELMSDEPFLSTFNDTLVPLLRRGNYLLRRIYIKGAASPEGPYDNNRRLGIGRANRLEGVIRNGFKSADSTTLSTDYITEDYPYLLFLMRQKHDRDYSAIARIWKQSSGNEHRAKKMMMQYRRGTTWRRLLKEYFPQLREARMMMWLTRPEMKDTVAIDSALVTVPESSTPVATPVTNTSATETAYTRRHLIALRTNLLHDFAYVPQFGWAPSANLQVEYYPLSGHYTWNIGFSFSNHRHWNDYKFFQIRDLELEVRRYFKGKGQFIGPFLNAYLEGVSYGIGFNDHKGWEGEGGGASIGGGYAMKLNRKGNLRLEFTLDFGVLFTQQDPYIYGNPRTGKPDGLYYYDYKGNASDFKKRDHHFTWFGPTNAGIHITYDIIYRKKTAK